MIICQPHIKTVQVYCNWYKFRDLYFIPCNTNLGMLAFLFKCTLHSNKSGYGILIYKECIAAIMYRRHLQNCRMTHVKLENDSCQILKCTFAPKPQIRVAHCNEINCRSNLGLQLISLCHVTLICCLGAKSAFVLLHESFYNLI